MTCESCETCRFYSSVSLETMKGYCRKNPPAVIVIETRDQCGAPCSRPDAQYPFVSSEGWCGCYEPGNVDALHANLTPLEHECLEILNAIYDECECSLDMHGCCQAHSWMTDDEECPHARAKALLKRCGVIQLAFTS